MLIAAIDRYEGCGARERAVPLFRREAVRVALADGKELDAWIYRFAGRTKGRPAHSPVRVRMRP